MEAGRNTAPWKTFPLQVMEKLNKDSPCGFLKVNEFCAKNIRRKWLWINSPITFSWLVRKINYS